MKTKKNKTIISHSNRNQTFSMKIEDFTILRNKLSESHKQIMNDINLFNDIHNTNKQGELLNNTLFQLDQSLNLLNEYKIAINTSIKGDLWYWQNEESNSYKKFQSYIDSKEKMENLGKYVYKILEHLCVNPKIEMISQQNVRVQKEIRNILSTIKLTE